jgi:hypothetical protein
MKYPIAVTDNWHYNHSLDQKKQIWALMGELANQDKTSLTDNGTWSHYGDDGSPTKYFADMESAMQYVGLIVPWMPFQVVIRDLTEPHKDTEV